MPTVNMPEAATNLARLVEAVESGAESEIIIARDGHPAARLVPVMPARSSSKRLGLADGRYPIVTQEEFDADNEEIAKLFHGEE